MIAIRAIIVGGALALGTAAPLAAQQAQPASDTANAALQARVRQRLAAVVQERLGLTDDQVRAAASSSLPTWTRHSSG